jgi:YYY domain-containing protein
MDWLIISFYWWSILFLLGIIFYPLTRRIFSNFFDFAYPFSKVLAIVFISYTIYVLGTLKIVSFSFFNLILIIFIFLIFNFFLWKKTEKERKKESSHQFFLIFLEEFLFITAFFFWVFVRSQEPSIHSLEKFMDFGFINSILRSHYFPPLDMWYSADNLKPQGYTINYYYFGHLSAATLIKLLGIKSAIGYNLILATIFALGISTVFSLVFNLIFFSNKLISQKINDGLFFGKAVFISILGSLITNLGGNFHTVYLFTKGYPNDNPIPFWKILSWFNPSSYWYPNATRFIPYTIHEFPSYSYVVADLHGHVFDIPFVLLTLLILLRFFFLFKDNLERQNNWFLMIVNTLLIGFMIAINYMTNAFDGPIYFLLAVVLSFLIFKISAKFVYSLFIILYSFLFFSLPFSFHFKPFVGGIGVNCAPSFLVNIGHLKPFLFEKGNCQISPLWMLFLLWGFFWMSFLIFLFLKNKEKLFPKEVVFLPKITDFILVIFSFGTFLILIPEFFYIKDIYPAHFRANTMFKMGYQAFIMMSISSTIVFYQISNIKLSKLKIFLKTIFSLMLFFVLIYPFFAIPSYYGDLRKKPQIDGSLWLKDFYPQDKEIIDYLNKNVLGQPVILEAQGDSYTDYERISAFTGLPTVAGWWVHQWLWRGSADVVGKRIPDIQTIYELNLYDDYQEYYTVRPNDYLIKIAEKIKFDNWKMIYELNKDKIKNPNLIFPNQKLVVLKERRINKNKVNDLKNLLKKYHIKYVIVSSLERQKYPNLNEEKFSILGKKIFESSNKLGALYQVN